MIITKSSSDWVKKLGWKNKKQKQVNDHYMNKKLTQKYSTAKIAFLLTSFE